jgi:hypothetical protein
VFFDGFLCLTWSGYPDTLAPCRAPCEWSFLARSIILLRQSYGGTSVMDRGDRREDILIIGTAKGAKSVLHRSGRGQH